MIQYVVVCACTGHIEALAYLDDDRATGGALTVTAAPGATEQIVIGYQAREGFTAPGHGAVAGTWPGATVTKTIWEDTGDYADAGRTQWTIHCHGCSRHPEMNTDTLTLIADELAAAPDELPEVMCPDPAASVEVPRHILQLSVLLRRLSRPIG